MTTGEQDPEPRGGDRERRVRLRLTLAIPAAVVFVALAAGAGAVSILRILVPAVEASDRALLWAYGSVAGFAVLSGAGAWLFARRLHQTFWRLVDEVRVRLEGDTTNGNGGDREDGEGGAAARPRGPMQEYELVRRTLDGYLRRVDHYRWDAEVLEEIDEAVVVLDGDGRVQHANRRAGELLAGGGDAETEWRETLPGRSLETFLPDTAEHLPLRSFVRRSLEFAGREGEGRHETTLREDLTLAPAGGAPQAVRARAHIPGDHRVVLALSPVSEEEQAERQRERRNRLAELGTLVAEVAHEIRNPLGGLRGMVGLLDEELPERDGRREVLRSIAERVDEVTSYLDEILDYAQPRQLEKEEVDARREAEAAVREVRALAEEREVEVSVEGRESVGLRADPRRLRQVLVNLLQNAVEHTPEGGRVTIRVEREDGPGDEGGEPSGDGVAEISVHNPDSFVPEDRRSEIFQPFVTTREDGTGLGLTVSRYLVTLHGGSIGVESDRETGTTATVRLPANG